MGRILVRKADKPDWLPDLPPQRETEHTIASGDDERVGASHIENRDFGVYKDPFVSRHPGAQVHDHIFRGTKKNPFPPEGMRLSKVLGRWFSGKPDKHPEMGVEAASKILGLPEIVPAWREYQQTQKTLAPLAKLKWSKEKEWKGLKEKLTDTLLDLQPGSPEYEEAARNLHAHRQEVADFHNTEKMQKLEKLQDMARSQRAAVIEHVLGFISPNAPAFLSTLGLRPHWNSHPNSLQEMQRAAGAGVSNPQALEQNMESIRFGTHFGSSLRELRDLQSREDFVDTSERARGGTKRDRREMWRAGLGRRLRTTEADVAAGERMQEAGQEGLQERKVDEAIEDAERMIAEREKRPVRVRPTPGSPGDVYSRDYRGETVWTDEYGRRPFREVGAQHGGAGPVTQEEIEARTSRIEENEKRRKMAKNIAAAHRKHIRTLPQRLQMAQEVGGHYDDHLAQQPEEGEGVETALFDARGMPKPALTDHLNRHNLWPHLPEHFPVAGGTDDWFVGEEGAPTEVLMDIVQANNLKPLLPTLFGEGMPGNFTVSPEAFVDADDAIRLAAGEMRLGNRLLKAILWRMSHRRG